VKEKANKLHF